MKRFAICIKIESVCHKSIPLAKLLPDKCLPFTSAGVEPGSGFAVTLTTTLLAGFPLHDAVMQFGAAVERMSNTVIVVLIVI